MTTVRIVERAIEILNPDLFENPKGSTLSRLAERLLLIPEVKSLSVHPRTGTVRIGFSEKIGPRQEFLERIGACLEGAPSGTQRIKASTFDVKKTIASWIREEDGFTAVDLELTERGQLVFTDRRLGRADSGLVGQMNESVGTRPGVRGIQHLPSENRLIVRFNPNRLEAEDMVDALVDALTREASLATLNDPNKIPMAVSTTTVGLGTLGQLLIPAATPIAAGILVATNYHAVKDAAGQLTRGKVGVPLFHTALLACSIVTGQVLAFALTDWSLRYWQRRWRGRLVAETEQTIQAHLPTLVQVRHIGEDGIERLLSIQNIRIGDRLRILSGEMIPADGDILEGTALIDETAFTGCPYGLRKQAPMKVLAGSTVLSGQVEMIVRTTGEKTRAAHLARVIEQTITRLPADPVLYQLIQKLGDRTAPPVLATAGVGWALGSLITVGAILHQDWVSGPYFAVPLVTLQQLREALANGIVTLNPSALLRLSEINFLVLDGDDPHLYEPTLTVRIKDSALAKSSALLQAVIGAGLYLGDERTPALLRLADEQGLPVKRPTLIQMEPGCVDALEGRHRIRLETRSKGPTLSIEIDGKSVGDLEFELTQRPAASDLVQMAQRLGYEVFLMSEQSEAETEQRALQLGIPLHGGELDVHGKRQFLEGLSQRGVKVALAGSVETIAPLTQSAHVSLGNGTLDGVRSEIDFVNQGRYGVLADLLAQAQRYLPEIRQANRKALVPNLLCVAGAFGGVLNGITSGIIANVAVANVDRSLQRKLSQRPVSRARLLTPRNT